MFGLEGLMDGGNVSVMEKCVRDGGRFIGGQEVWGGREGLLWNTEEPTY